MRTAVRVPAVFTRPRPAAEKNKISSEKPLDINSLLVTASPQLGITSNNSQVVPTKKPIGIEFEGRRVLPSEKPLDLKLLTSTVPEDQCEIDAVVNRNGGRSFTRLSTLNKLKGEGFYPAFDFEGQFKHVACNTDESSSSDIEIDSRLASLIFARQRKFEKFKSRNPGKHLPSTMPSSKSPRALIRSMSPKPLKSTGMVTGVSSGIRSLMARSPRPRKQDGIPFRLNRLHGANDSSMSALSPSAQREFRRISSANRGTRHHRQPRQISHEDRYDHPDDKENEMYHIEFPTTADEEHEIDKDEEDVTAAGQVHHPCPPVRSLAKPQNPNQSAGAAKGGSEHDGKPSTRITSTEEEVVPLRRDHSQSNERSGSTVPAWKNRPTARAREGIPGKTNTVHQRESQMPLNITDLIQQFSSCDSVDDVENESNVSKLSSSFVKDSSYDMDSVRALFERNRGSTERNWYESGKQMQRVLRGGSQRASKVGMAGKRAPEASSIDMNEISVTKDSNEKNDEEPIRDITAAPSVPKAALSEGDVQSPILSAITPSVSPTIGTPESRRQFFVPETMRILEEADMDEITRADARDIANEGYSPSVYREGASEQYEGRYERVTDAEKVNLKKRFDSAEFSSDTSGRTGMKRKDDEDGIEDGLFGANDVPMCRESPYAEVATGKRRETIGAGTRSGVRLGPRAKSFAQLNKSNNRKGREESTKTRGRRQTVESKGPSERRANGRGGTAGGMGPRRKSTTGVGVSSGRRNTGGMTGPSAGRGRSISVRGFDEREQGLRGARRKSVAGGGEGPSIVRMTREQAGRIRHQVVALRRMISTEGFDRW